MRSFLKIFSLIFSVVVMIAVACIMYCLGTVKLDIPNDAKYYHGSMYFVFSSDVSWAQAEWLCRKRGGHLATIKDKAENNFVSDLIDKHKEVTACWIGTYSRLNSDFSRDCVWVNDKICRFFDRSLLMMRPCKNDYFYINRTGRWMLNNTGFCSPNGYACEWEVGKVTGIRQVYASNSSIKLCWRNCPSAKDYTVYYYDTDMEKYVEYKTVKKPSITVRGLESGRVYRFAVCMTINNKGKKCKLVKTHFSAVTEPEGVNDLQIKDKVYLMWSKVKGADGYDIYLYNKDMNEWKILNTVKDNTYKIGRKIGSDYQKYKVRAFKKSNNGTKFYSRYSNEVKR